MPNIVRSVSRLVDQDDVQGLLSALVDGYSLAYDASSGQFVLRRMASYDSVFGETAALTTAGALATLFDAESGGTHDAYFGAYVFAELADGTLLAGIGNRPADNDGALIVSISAAGAVTLEKKLDEQGVHEMRVHDGKVYVLGSDAALGDDWTYGNVYVRSAAGVWTKRRTLPNVLHCLSQCWTASSSGTWYVGTGAHTGDNATWKGYVFKSTDDGATWTRLAAAVTDYRVYNLAWFRGRLYAAGMTQDTSYDNTAYIYTSTDDGATWVDSGTTIWARTRWVEFDGQLVAVGSARTTLVVVAADGSLSSVALPGTAVGREYQAHVLMVAGDRLYVLGKTAIYSSADLSNWETHYTHGLTAPTGLGYWSLATTLPLCSAGANALITKVAVSSQAQFAALRVARDEHAADSDAHHAWPLTEDLIPGLREMQSMVGGLRRSMVQVEKKPVSLGVLVELDELSESDDDFTTIHFV